MSLIIDEKLRNDGAVLTLCPLVFDRARITRGDGLFVDDGW